jgi:preprotein translocase subunit SecD
VVFAQITRELADRARSTGEDQLLAIVVDGEVKSAPRVLEEIPDGLAEITGRFTLDEVKSLVAVLNSGQVPLRLRPAQAH